MAIGIRFHERPMLPQGVNTMDLHLHQLHLPIGTNHRVRTSAVFSPCRRYRYRLSRSWASSMPVLGVVMLQPDDHTDNRTLRRISDFAEGWGYGGIDVCNVYGLRARSPLTVRTHADPVGANNDVHLAQLGRQRDLIVLAWGEMADQRRAAHVTQLLLRACRPRAASLAVLGWTYDGQPAHPCDLPKSTPLQCLTLDHGQLPEVADPRWGRLMMATAA